MNSIVSAIRTLFYGNAATEYREAEDEYDIFLQLGEGERRTINDLMNSDITANGRRYRLDALATISEEERVQIMGEALAAQPSAQ